MQRLLCFLFAAICILPSCKKSSVCTRSITCDTLAYIPVFVGYDSTEIDSVILYAYKKDGTFSSLVSQQVYSQLDSVINYGSGSSGPLYYKYTFINLGLAHYYDYIIYIPKANQTFRLYSITDKGGTDTVECDYPGDCITSSSISVSGENHQVIANNIRVTYILFSK